MATKAVCLPLAQHKLVQMGTRQQLVACLETHHNNSPSGVDTITDTSSSPNTLPQEELDKLAVGHNDSQQYNPLVPTPHTGS